MRETWQMIVYARLRPGPGFEPDRAVFYYFQRMVTVRAVRSAISRAISFMVRLRQGATPAPEGEMASAEATLRRQGLAMLPGLVPAPTLASMTAYFAGKPVIGDNGAPADLRALPPGTGMASYDMRTILECPGLIELVNAAPVLALAGAYLGCKPTLSSLGVRWSLPGGDRAASTQHYHRDPDDWRFLKLFIYLTDVDEESGPHRYVMTSHRTAGRFRGSFYDPAAVAGRYGSENLASVTGPAGTAFIADTHGIHAGAVPTRQARLILQAQYSLLPVYALHYEPVVLADAPAAADPYVNRLLYQVAA